MENAWKEIHHGADMFVPGIYKFIIKYITPLFLLIILGVWFYQQGFPTIMMKGVPAANRGYILGARLGLLSMFLVLAVLVKIAWNKRYPKPKGKVI